MQGKTPYEMALEKQGQKEIDYCDECENFKIVGSACYCSVTGKMLHPLMYERGQGTGPARHCDKRGTKGEASLKGAEG